jgi:hypothetical protein
MIILIGAILGFIGKLIDYYKDGVHSIPLGQLGHEVHGNTFPWFDQDQ